MSEELKPHVVKSHDIRLDSDYVSWVHDVKQRYVSAQIKSAVKVNTEQLFFNWQLGRDLVERKAEEKWGKGIVEQLSLDLQNEFPKAKGFSARNLWNMKKWYLFYSGNESFSELAHHMEESLDMKSLKLQQVGVELDQNEKLQQLVAEINFPKFFGFVPWGHHIEIVTKCKTVEEALFYVRKTIEESWSRSVLIDNIKAHLYQSSGNALTNFAEKLPTIQGKLAQEIVKDTYDFGFVSLPAGYDEKELEDALEQNITRFLLELGSGFAFIGRQKEIIVAGKTRKIDMLFYHIKLRYLDFAESMTLRHIPLTMQDWEKRLNSFIEMFDYGILQDAGKVTAEIAKLHAETEFEKYRVIQDRLFMSDFDRYMLELEESTKK